MLQTSLLLMKSLNKTETPICLSVVCSLFPKAIFFTFIIISLLILEDVINILIFAILALEHYRFSRDDVPPVQLS